MYHIFYGRNATALEITACQDLKQDLKAVTSAEVQINAFSTNDIDKIKLEVSGKENCIVVGSPTTNRIIKELSETKKIPVTLVSPGKRGGVIHITTQLDNDNGNKILILAGSDDQGAQYAVYDFSRYVLGVDPYQYWTGILPKSNPTLDIFAVKNKIIPPPLVPILGYFDNDNDELANLTKPYLEFSFEQWQAIIDTLVRLKYNAIDIHDHLGRAEFYRWPHYQKLVPNYKPNVELLNRLIDYAHDRGVMIQVSFYLGWKFKVISDAASLNWKDNRQEWVDVWKYYLEQTPIGKCDIFLNRPRDQRWDRKYKGKGKDNDPVTVFNEAFPEMVRVIKNHNPNAIVIVDLYSEGRRVFENGFRPEPKEDYIMAWPDNGFGKFEYLPKDLDGYKFGIYMHAGFYLNHVVQDPYPELLYEQMKAALIENGMAEYCLVNGQTFRHYLLNLEACSAICENPQTFNPEKFYKDWCANYFGEEYAEEVVSILKLLHKGQDHRCGYINTMNYLKFFIIRSKLIKYGFFLPKKWINTLYEKIANLGKSFTPISEQHVKDLSEALNLAENVHDKVENPIFFYDHILLQVKLLFQLSKIINKLQLAAFGKNRKELINDVIELVKEHHHTRIEGDKDPKWKNWYDPSVRRPNGGYFDMLAIQSRKKLRIHNNR